jgi:hypothetical protein
MSLVLERAAKLVFKAEWSMLAAVNAADSPNLKTVFAEDTGWTKSPQNVLLKYEGDAFVEPKYGYIISANGLLIEDSLKPNIASNTAAPWRTCLPTPASFRDAVKNRSSIQHFPKLISLRHFWEWNFFHFYNDVLGRLSLIDSLLDKSMPLLLGNYADDIPFVKQIIEIGGLADRNWVLPGHNYVSADEIYYCHSGQSWKERFSYTVSQMNLPKPDPDSTERIFLLRPEHATRRLLNQSEIDPVLKKYKFQAIDTSQMPIAEQIATFAKARHVIAIHGAGILNIIFRDGAPMSLIELRPDVYWTEDMQEMCEQYGYDSTFLTGKSESGPIQHASFVIDPRQLERKIEEMLATEQRPRGHVDT